MADTPTEPCALAILVALAKLSADMKDTRNRASSEHLRRGLAMADELLHSHARLYSRGIAPPATAGGHGG